MTSISRRDTLRLATGAVAAVILPREQRAAAAAAAPRTGLGLVTYCLGLRQRAEKRRDPAVDLFEPLTFLDHCRQLGAGGIQTALGVRDAAYTTRLRERAEQAGMFVEGIVGPPGDEADVGRFEAEIRTAAAAGARAVRTVVFPGRRYEQFGDAEAFRAAADRARRTLELAAPVVARHRVRLAVENHKDQRLGERLELLRQLSSEWIGACVDTGNSLALLEDPLAVVEAFAPWAYSVHLKDQTLQATDDGFLLADVPMGEGCLDLKRMVAVLRQAQPDVRFSLELITRDPLKVPCLTEKYWATLADVPGRDLARTLRLVRERQAAVLPQVSTLAPDEQVAREETNIRTSLAYARDVLGV